MILTLCQVEIVVSWLQERCALTFIADATNVPFRNESFFNLEWWSWKCQLWVFQGIQKYNIIFHGSFESTCNTVSHHTFISTFICL